MPHFPTLALIDRALGNPSHPFGSSLAAAALEREARILADDYWSDTVWATGIVSETALLRVRDELERRRAALEAARRERIDVKLVVIGPDPDASLAPSLEIPEPNWPLSQVG